MNTSFPNDQIKVFVQQKFYELELNMLYTFVGPNYDVY